MEIQYRIKENGFKEIKKKMILRTIPISLLAVGGGIAASHFNNVGQSSDINVLPFVIPFILAAMAVGLTLGIKRQKKIFNSYKLIIDEEKIIRQQDLLADVEIPLHEIKEIIKNKNGSIVIKGRNLNNSIGVPFQLEKINELESTLSKILEITQSNKKTLLQRFSWALPILSIGLMMIVYLSKNKCLVGFAGVTLTLGLIYSLVVTQKSKHIDKKTKKGMWLVLIVLFSVIGITYIKIFGS